MTTSKIKSAIASGVRKITMDYMASIFPQANPDWTDAQRKAFEEANGESGMASRLNDSDRPEFIRMLSEHFGIDIKSRHNLNEIAIIPNYCVVVLRNESDEYPSSFPLIHSRIMGYFTEQGRGGGREIGTRIKNLRPTTEDDINRLFQKFPDDKMFNLYGAIEFKSEAKFRKAVTATIQAQTQEFKKDMEPVYPEGISAKGLALLKLGGVTPTMREILSIVLDDPKMMEDYKEAPNRVTFPPFSAIVPIKNEDSISYFLDQVHVQAGASPHNIFFSLPDEGSVIGNHMTTATHTFRIPTPDEIETYVKEIPADRLHLYAPALTPDEITSLL